MAKLNDVAESLNVKLDINPQPTTLSHEKTTGHKRRAWITNENSDESKGVYTPLNSTNEKGSIDPIYKPHSSTPYINPIDQPLYQKGSIHPISKPLNIDLSKLRGNPLKIAQYIFELLKKTSVIATEKITLLEMMKALEISKDSARTGLRFLLKNELVKRVGFQIGKHGWSKYELKKSLFDELENAYIKGSIHPLNLKGSNSSSYINTTTTTDKPLSNWNFDITSYLQFGFTSSHIKQLAALGVISATDVEQSLKEFSFDLENDSLPQMKKTKIEFLMGILRKGGKYISTAYINEDDAAILEMARRASEKQENLLKAKFEAWEAGLSDDERKEIEKKLPTYLMVLHRAHGVSSAEVRKWLFDYYLQVTN